MLCVFTAAGVGHRPENSDKETTSLEMPSLPASDGFENPVQSSELSSKICNPTDQLLDRSLFAPASTRSNKSSLTEPIDPRAIKSFESSTKCQITPGRDHPLVLQHLSNNSSLANNDHSLQTEEVNSCSPACLSQETLEETFLADSLMECNTTEQGCGEEPLLEVTKKNSLSDSTDELGQIKDAPLPSELKDRKQKLAINHQMWTEPEKFEHLEKQTDKTDPEHPGKIGGVEEEGHTASQPEIPPAEMREGSLEKADLSCVKEHVKTSCSCVDMEVDTAEHSVAEVHISAMKQKWQVRNGRASDLNSGASSIEVESLKSATSPSDAVSTPDVLQSKSTGEIPQKCNELSNLTAENSSSPSIVYQQDTDLGRHLEEPCFSLASALKELHKLLISCKGECKLLTSEVSQLEMVHKEQVQWKGFSEDKWKGSDRDGQQQSSSSFNLRSEGGKAEGNQPCNSGVENVSLGSVIHMESAPGEDALQIPEFSGKRDLTVVTSTGTSDQQESSEQAKVLPEWFQSPILEQNSVSSQPSLDKGTSQDTSASLTRALERSSSSAPDSPELVGGCEEPLPSPPTESTELPLVASPPAFPAADVDRILDAGFTTVEALEALERADGNADLALLILLAKSIVVPT
ncbi:regulatory solute carrier protein family 1 member 1 isoform X1 [Excalfactoria chinensis]|uniref:regulatory solute carrier protein family 1 member 1 isoform X1 n=1 Tax=Excalfactoria chinensis TaxID=46218 RepID=UPI003B3B0D7A